jgi:hypothetical protein
MLISKGLAVGEVITIKTSSGEELVAKLIEDGPMGVTVSKPLVLTAAQKGIALVPYLFTTDPDANMTILKNSIIVMAPTHKDAADQYLQTTSGIKLV